MNYKIYNRCIISGVKITVLNVFENRNRINFEIIPNKQKSEIIKYRNSMDSVKRLLARSFLFESFQEEYNVYDFTLIYNEFEKPFLKARSDIFFSFSYSKDFLAVAYSNTNIGIDIEYLNRSLQLDEMALEIMNPFELKRFKSLKNDQKLRLNYFFSLFSGKEAIIKAFGTGLSYGIKNLAVKKNYVYNYGNKLYRYKKLLKFHDEYEIAICYEIKA